MAFISFTYNGYDSATKQSIYTIADSEFGYVNVELGVSGYAGAVLTEYRNRGLPVGRNLALLTIYLHKRWDHSITEITTAQDKDCRNRFDNWDMYAKERDHHLAKLLLLQ